MNRPINQPVTAVPAIPIPAAPLPPQLAPEHLQQLAAARAAARKVRRAAAVATFDGWTIALFAALSLVTSLTDPSGLLLSLGMIAVAVVELRGAAALKRLRSAAARMLGFNQLALASMLICYALWRLYAETSGPSPYAAYTKSDPELAQMLGPIESLTRTIALYLYGAMIAVALFAQGGLAAYYFTRRQHIDAYLRQTPEWILAMQRSGVPL
jgi:hypothetical protein